MNARYNAHQIQNSTLALKHLVLVPINGMCNRMRAIASACRLCRLVGAQCTVEWKWGDIESFFQPMQDLAFCSNAPDVGLYQKKHMPEHINPARTVNVANEVVRLRSDQVFWGIHEKPIQLKDVLNDLPKLSLRLQKTVDSFRGEYLKNAVGLHMRRTDHEKAKLNSPDALFITRAREVISCGKVIFLATDNIDTEQMMKRLFGDAIITFPKRQNLKRRWPRGFNQTAAEDDLMEFFLLAATEYIVGSYWSSFSGTAISINGSPRCEILKVKENIPSSEANILR